MKEKVRRFPVAAAFLAIGIATSGCSTTKEMMKWIGNDTDEVLPGARESVLPQTAIESSQTTANDPVVVPAAVSNASWAQPGGVPSHALQNLALGPQLSKIFAVSAGDGSDSYGRLTASPIVVGGRVYVLDTHATVRVFSADGGASLWSRSLVPEGRDSDGAFGGGLASDGGRIFATTAFGEAMALDAATGADIWRKKFDAPIRAAPTVADGRVFFITISNEVQALSTEDGSTIWHTQGTGERASVISSTSPAVANGYVVVPFTSGDVTAFSLSDGQPIWSNPLSTSDFTSSLASLNDVAGRPVIADGQVYAIAHSGRMAAILLSSGEQIWSQELSGTQTPWVAGAYAFVLAGRSNIVAIARTSGAVRWSQTLPGGGVWAGPVLGGGRLIAVSSNGTLANISPQTGEVLSNMELGDAFYIPPVIANGVIYLLADSGELIALR